MPGTDVTVVSGRRDHRAVSDAQGSRLRCWFLCPGLYEEWDMGTSQSAPRGGASLSPQCDDIVTLQREATLN